ncbi:MAG: hypothetical protein JWN04_1045 [Myxococcaceae bacterium]|nr:hypothetical protein [Myxococcaceae bacterium]
MRLWLPRTTWVLGYVLLQACAATPRPDPKTAGLRTVVEPASAIVQVDEHFVGAARVLDKRPAPLLPGKHRVTVEAPGYFPHDLEVDLAPGVTTVDLKLRKTPP